MRNSAYFKRFTVNSSDLKLVPARVKKFNEDEARNAHGEWTSGDDSSVQQMMGYANEVAIRMVTNARNYAPILTRDVVTAIHAGGGERARSLSPQGVDTTIKSPDRVTEKLTEDLRNTGQTSKAAIAQEAYNIGDIVRYTGLYDPSKMAEGVEKTVNSLQQAGYEPLRIKNFFNEDPNNAYRGINSVWNDPRTGLKFELQFHTPASIAESEKWHGVYEQIRTLPMTSDAYQSAAAAMRAGFASVPIPPGIESIGTRAVKKRLMKIGRRVHKSDIIELMKYDEDEARGPDGRWAGGDASSSQESSNDGIKPASIRGTSISDQDLINAEHGNVSNKAVGHSCVFRTGTGAEEKLDHAYLFIEPRFNARSLAREYGARMLNGARLVSMERSA